MDAAIKELKEQFPDKLYLDKEHLDFNSVDGSIFSVRPQAVFYPENEADVVALVKWVNAKAAEGLKIPIAARGAGTDQGGGPLTDGIAMVFTKHMNETLAIMADSVRVQPGKIYGDLQRELKAHGRYIPCYPASLDISTVGGAVANNAAGEKTLKYGSTRKFIESLRVVLSDGEVVETAKLTYEELEAKKSQTNFEGELYRGLDQMLLDHAVNLAEARINVTKNSAGYDVWDLKDQFTFDLGQLICGSQGTLGIVTEITFRTIPMYKACVLLAGYFDDIHKAGIAVEELLPLNPVAIETVDKHLISMVGKHDPKLLEGLLPEKMPELVILVEFDGDDRDVCGAEAGRALETIKQYTYDSRIEYEEEEQERLWKLRRSAAAVIWTVEGKKKALPIIEDGTVPPREFPHFLHEAYQIFNKYGLEIAIWGHAGDADLHMQPFLDLSDAKDVEKVYAVMDDFYKMIHRLGGTTCGEHNDGILRTPFLKYIYPEGVLAMFGKIKQLFDPTGILNPGKKTDISLEYAKAHLRREYSLKSIVEDREKINR